MTEEKIEKWKIARYIDGILAWERETINGESFAELELENLWVNSTKMHEVLTVKVKMVEGWKDVMDELTEIIRKYYNEEDPVNDPLWLAEKFIDATSFVISSWPPRVELHYTDTGGDYPHYRLYVAVD
ncbi:MAG: hypothetical protein QXT28_08810 [Thermofilaceae archaeon]